MSKKTIDIAIIQPPGWSVQSPPLGLALLKSYLAMHNFLVKNFDLNILLYNLRRGRYFDAWELSKGYYLWNSESFVKTLFSHYRKEIFNMVCSVLCHNPKVIGLSVHCSTFISAKLLALKFKQLAPGIKIIFGGPQVAPYTKLWNELLTGHIADAIVFGEGEETLKCYLGSLNYTDGRVVDGAAYLGGNGEVAIGGERDGIKSLDNLPFADFSDFDPGLYLQKNVLPTYFSRGCINKCIYCTENKYFPKFRNRSGQRVYDEIKHQLRLHPKTSFFRMQDSVSNGNMRELESFCDLLIENNLQIGFNLENAVVRKEMTDIFYKKLKKAGCYLIGYGLEHPSKKLLKNIGKNACLDADFEEVICDGAKNNIIIGINMMFGLPGETEEDSRVQLDLLDKIKDYRKNIIINPALNFCYFPEGSAAYSSPHAYNIDLSGGELYWSEKGGSNTFLERLQKFESFCSHSKKFGYSNIFGITRNLNKNELIGRYYYSLNAYDKSFAYLNRAFSCETRTAELALIIMDLYEKLSKMKDSQYRKIRRYIAASREKKNWIKCSGFTNTDFNYFENFSRKIRFYRLILNMRIVAHKLKYRIFKYHLR